MTGRGARRRGGCRRRGETEGGATPLGDHRLNASIAVSDIGRAAAFDEGRLGLTPVQAGPGARIPGGSRISAAGGGPALAAHQSETAGASRATVAVWLVDDIEAIVDELAAAGVEMTVHDEFEHDAMGISPRARRRADRLVPGPRRQHARDRGRRLTRRRRHRAP